jgi:multidrug efflux pump subunit AcrA (membrane-fusion protein)
LQQPHETGATRAIAAVRIALLVLIAIAGIGAAIVAYSGGTRVTGAPRYVCPMHHEITATTPGTCPICNMALVAMQEAAAMHDTVHQRRSAIDQARRRVFSQDLAALAMVEADGSITATLYRDELATLLSGSDLIRFTTHGATRQSFPVEVSAGPPEVWDESTLHVRFELVTEPGAKPMRLNPGTIGAITARLEQHEALIVLDTAVLHGEHGPYVLVASADGTHFEPRPIEIGRSQNGMTFVTSGLEAGERVAAGLAFFADAERQLHEGASAPPAGAP